MGMPIITPGTGTRNQAVTDLIQSVALQETALSHILNAEGEKMQAIIGMTDVTLEEMMEMNESVKKLINAATRLEMMFLSKLEMFSDPYVPDPTNAEAELAKIDMPSITINVPLNDPTAQQIAIARAITATQLQIDPGYTVSFMLSAFDPTGSLIGAFTVTNNIDPTDTATDAVDRIIAVTTTATTAEQELSKINVTAVTIPVPLTDPNAQQSAVTQAIHAAQAQVDPGYTVSFIPTSYDPNSGMLIGVFAVTNITNPNDTATDTAARIITVTYVPSTAIAASNAAAQFISGTLLTGDLSSIVGIDGAAAQYINGVTPGTTVVDAVGLDVNALSAAPVVINSIDLPLGSFLQLGVINQYAQASIDGASRAFSGAVSNGGVVSIGGSVDFPANATLDLMKLLPATQLLTQADLDIGTIIGAAQWSASVGNTLAITTDATNPVQGRTYNIAGADLDLNSPAVSDLVNLFDNITNDASIAVSNLGSDILNGLLIGVDGVMSTLDNLVPGVSILSNNLSVNVSLVDLSAELAPILQTPIASGDGVLTVNFSAGTVNTDLNQLFGINGLPPNTDLLSPTVIDAVVADLNEVLQTLQTKVQDLIMSKLTGTAAVAITGGIDLLEVLGVPTAGLNISYNGTLADLVTNTQPLIITGTGTLEPFFAALSPLVSTIQTTLGLVLNPLINDPTTGILPTAINAISSDVIDVSNQLSPVFSLISSVISIIINVQQNNVDGANTFTEIPVQLNLLNDGTVLNLGKVVVGPNTYTA